ncbi:hypothetical protein S7711_11332 [Stachybotrys chartarum IBT 7711]|uniref:DOMON domain-containing protein n=1 Tax=Stachybotrys chartarum (strain CBS 109288 / IBT 7711) TaxID=1280523 RepID=A0A084AL86_STACB|nr:hypothetical protein S7711_11332 [Stachybotrys chartarum IBT 7711]
MHIRGVLLISSALAPLVQAVTFNYPDTSRPINLSEPVVFEWTIADDDGHQGYSFLQLGFSSHNVGTWWISNPDDRINARNTSSYTWDAPTWAEEMIEVHQIVRSGRNNWFETHVYQAQYSNQSSGFFPEETERFEVIGYPYLESGSKTMVPSLLLGFSAGALAIFASLVSTGL